jgi:hypothetical protein
MFSLCYAQKNFKGVVVNQTYIRLDFKSPVKLQEPVKLNILRLELGRYLIPYWGVDRFIQTLDVGSATRLVEVNLKLEPDSSGMFQYEDHAVRSGSSYIYWVQSPSKGIIASPLCLKVRDPKVWMSQEAIELIMDSLKRNYPNVVKKQKFGTTYEGNQINGLLVGNLNNAILLVGNVHAGESGAEIHLSTIKQILLKNYKMLDKAGIIIVPVLNIDNRNRLINGFPDYLRTNIREIDLNRNFPADWDVVDSSYEILTNDPFSSTYRGPSPGSEPETKTIIGIIEKYKPKVVFSYHWMGCITGSNLLSDTRNPEVLPGLQKYAECFYEGFFENSINPPKYNIGQNNQPGTLPRYCVLKHNIPAFDVEGNTRDPVLTRAHSDMASKEDLNEFQQKHYNAIKSVLQSLSSITD